MNLKGWKEVCFFWSQIRYSELLLAMDMFLFPSLYEGLPVTLMEAQASGLKILASDTITNEVAITDNVEFMSLNKSAKAWADRIMKYSNGYERKDTSQEIVSAGYDIKSTRSGTKISC